jgi:hypothetical protein
VRARPFFSLHSNPPQKLLRLLPLRLLQAP